jgi:DMSO/TMAO reductase YedYZ molybdopterin-dependent catalytic subunit
VWIENCGQARPLYVPVAVLLQSRNDENTPYFVDKTNPYTMSTPPRSNTNQTMLLLLVGATTTGAVVLWTQLSRRRRRQQDNASTTPINLTAKGQREVHKKQRLAQKSQAPLVAVPIDNESSFIPPGNFEASKWLRADLGITQLSNDYNQEESEWKLRLKYRDHVVALTAADLRAMPSYKCYDNVSWHCVTGWSKHGIVFWGVPLQDVVSKFLTLENSDWTWAFQTCADGYTCPIQKQDVLHPRAFLALQEDGEWLSLQHGGPRLVIPHLWGWKSAKWMMELEFTKDYRAGFWENLVCHHRGRIYDPKTMLCVQERWASGYGMISDVLTSIVNVYYRWLGPEVYAKAMAWGGKLVGLAANVLLTPIPK